MSEWQPMKEVPVGVPFLASDLVGRMRVCAVCHDPERSREIPGRWPWSPKDTVIFQEEGDFLYGVTFSATGWGPLTLGDDWEPTHWMPLPEPPK